MWSNIITSSRNLAQQIWLHVPTDRTGMKGPTTTELQNIIEKKTMINLVCKTSLCEFNPLLTKSKILAFAVAVKVFTQA